MTFYFSDGSIEEENGNLYYFDRNLEKYLISYKSIKGINKTKKMAVKYSDKIIENITNESGHYSGYIRELVNKVVKVYTEERGEQDMNFETVIEKIQNMSDNIEDIADDLNEIKHNKNTSNMTKFEEAMLQGIIDKGKELATEDLEKELKVKLDKFIQDTYGAIPKKIEINNKTQVKQIEGIFHKEFENILKIVDKGIPLMLTGPAGSGKNHTLEQVAEALDLDFYFTNAVTQEYKLTGFIDANGTYHQTEFYKAFKNGGIFFLDEMDASVPEALIVLNSAIANGYFDFPSGRVNAHENFRVVSASNTYGTGADMVYVGRNVLDGATLDRFAVIKFDYDEEVEKQLAYNEALYNFIKALRKVLQENSLRYIVSMRATINATKMLEVGFDESYILKNVIIKNMQIDDINTIIKKINCNNIWTNRLKDIVNYGD